MAHHSMSRRAFLRRSATLGAVAIGGPTLLTACPGEEEETLARAREQGFIRVGFANEAPYGYADEAGNLTGQAPEVARVVLRELGIDDMDGVVAEFGSLIPGLQARRFDLIAAGMFLTPERCEQILFSDPDYCAPQGLLVESGNPLDINDYDDIAGNPDVTLGVMSGAVEVDQALDAGVDDGQLERLPDPPSLGEALEAGRIDAVALTTISLHDLNERVLGGQFEVTEAFVPVVDGEEQFGCGGYGFRHDDEEFFEEFNTVLNELKQANDIVGIVEEFGFAEADELGQDVNREDLCP